MDRVIFANEILANELFNSPGGWLLVEYLLSLLNKTNIGSFTKR